MKKPIPVNPQTKEEEVEDFKALAPSLVKEGYITRKQGEFGTSVDEVKSYLRSIAEQELKKQGK
jgi:hypothetical protein